MFFWIFLGSLSLPHSVPSEENASHPTFRRRGQSLRGLAPSHLEGHDLARDGACRESGVYRGANGWSL